MATSRPSSIPKFTVPSMTTEQGAEVAGVLQDRLNALNDLALTLKHIHWNVVGPQFIAVYTMLDPQVEAVREMVDETAERIATLGVAPLGTPGALVKDRSWDDYSVLRADAIAHRVRSIWSTRGSSPTIAKRRTPPRNPTPSATTC